MSKVKIGIIGIGNIGSSHVKRILDGETPELQLAAIADRSAARRQWAKDNLPEGVRIFTEGSELIDSGVCQAVIVATPHYQHPELAIRALNHGQHVMVEKPAGVYTLQAREMMAVADQHKDLTFGMMFNQRTNSLYRRMHEMIEAGEVGEIKRVNWIITNWYRTQFYYDSGAWRATWAGRAAACCSTSAPTSWTCSSGSADAQPHPRLLP